VTNGHGHGPAVLLGSAAKKGLLPIACCPLPFSSAIEKCLFRQLDCAKKLERGFV
jgi:hypothetical protein